MPLNPPRPCPHCATPLTDWTEDGWQCESCRHYGIWTAGFCWQCRTEVRSDSILDHLRLIHPDQWEEPPRWPDGRRVVIDETLDPADFNLRGGHEAQENQ